MEKSIFMEKYPVFSHKILKKDTQYKNVLEIISYLKAKIENHPIATFISIFDHYDHTSCLKEGEMMVGLKDAKNLIFCFGKQIPNTKILAIRPRSIAVSEFEDSFSIDFLEVPNEQLQVVVREWIESL
jgi:hypothetical protein